jgi:hypothetical protein
MMLKQILGGSAFVFGVCAALYGCGSADDSAPDGAAGASQGEAGAAEGGRGGAAEGGAAGELGAVEGGAAGQLGEAGEGGAAGASALHPPPSIDIKLCSDAAATPDACIDCCYNGGFLTSTIYNDKCVCGTPSDNPDVCGTSASASCFSCCNGAGYASATFNFGTPTQCSCTGKFDAKVCAPSANASDPESACRVCCLNDGYLHGDYDGTGAPSCTCGS